MDCITVDRELWDWLAGTLPAERGAALEAHARQCAGCRDAKAAAQRLSQRLDALGGNSRVDADFTEDVMQGLNAAVLAVPLPEPGAAQAPAGAPESRALYMWLLLAAAVLLTVLLLNHLQHAGSPRPDADGNIDQLASGTETKPQDAPVDPPADQPKDTHSIVDDNADDPERAALLERLNRVALGKIDFNAEPLSSVCLFLTEVSGVTVQLSQRCADENPLLTAQLGENMKIMDFLRLVERLTRTCCYLDTRARALILDRGDNPAGDRDELMVYDLGELEANWQAHGLMTVLVPTSNPSDAGPQLVEMADGNSQRVVESMIRRACLHTFEADPVKQESGLLVVRCPAEAQAEVRRVLMQLKTLAWFDPATSPGLQARRAMQERLDGAKLQNAQWQNESLTQVTDYLRESTGVDFILTSDNVRNAQITLSLKDGTAATLLDTLVRIGVIGGYRPVLGLRQCVVALHENDNAIEAGDCELGCFDIGPLVKRGMDEMAIRALLGSNCRLLDPDCTGFTFLVIQHTYLFVNDTPETLEKIHQLLDKLTKPRAIK